MPKYQRSGSRDIEAASRHPRLANGYVAMVQHRPRRLLADGVQRELFFMLVDTNLYSVGMLTSLGTIGPGAARPSGAARLFPGPANRAMMEKLYPGLELVGTMAG